MVHSFVLLEIMYSYMLSLGISVLLMLLTMIPLFVKLTPESKDGQSAYKLWLIGNIIFFIILIPIIYYIRNL